jgi:hypothetical protein
VSDAVDGCAGDGVPEPGGFEAGAGEGELEVGVEDEIDGDGKAKRLVRPSQRLFYFRCRLLPMLDERGVTCKTHSSSPRPCIEPNLCLY